ncbi:nitroreductase family deazaflavin-dependent oxidoreductase [Mycolicibacterium sp. Dal123E01]|uniref:nitroreductase family deazaflavin-dependent oxidoreductase n=1 Tax=Mycolicibacterium sp. Dal123E01 TaxID=3457578 RepID=UPI00403E4FA0
MAYLKPTWLVKKFSSIMAGTNVAERLTVTGRVSGEPRQVAVTSVNLDGVKYLVSTRGESQWVKNIRANPNVTLTVKGESTAYVAAEVPVQERAPVIAAFRPVLGRLLVGRYFTKLPAAADHPTFALAPPPAR